MMYVWTGGNAAGVIHQRQAWLNTLEQAAEMLFSNGGSILEVKNEGDPLHLMIDWRSEFRYTNDGRRVTVHVPVYPWDVLEGSDEDE